jgi:hypothetical protein
VPREAVLAGARHIVGALGGGGWLAEDWAAAVAAGGASAVRRDGIPPRSLIYLHEEVWRVATSASLPLSGAGCPLRARTALHRPQILSARDEKAAGDDVYKGSTAQMDPASPRAVGAAGGAVARVVDGPELQAATSALLGVSAVASRAANSGGLGRRPAPWSWRF